jgi:hypothetical protein
MHTSMRTGHVPTSPHRDHRRRGGWGGGGGGAFVRSSMTDRFVRSCKKNDERAMRNPTNVVGDVEKKRRKDGRAEATRTKERRAVSDPPRPIGSSCRPRPRERPRAARGLVHFSSLGRRRLATARWGEGGGGGGDFPSRGGGANI